MDKRSDHSLDDFTFYNFIKSEQEVNWDFSRNSLSDQDHSEYENNKEQLKSDNTENSREY